MSPKNAFNPAYNPVDGEWSKEFPNMSEVEGSQQNSNVGYIILYGISLFSNDKTIVTDNFIFDKSCFQLPGKNGYCEKYSQIMKKHYVGTIQ